MSHREARYETLEIVGARRRGASQFEVYFRPRSQAFVLALFLHSTDMSRYSDQLKDPRWQKKRLEIFQRDNFKCRSCGATEFTLHVHHWEYEGLPWEGDDNEKWTVCEFCHTRFHLQKRCAEMTEEFWSSIPVEAESRQSACIVRWKTTSLKFWTEFDKKLNSAVSLSPGSPEDSCDTNNTAKRTQVLQGDSCFIAATPENATGSTVSPMTGNPAPAQALPLTASR